MTKRREHVPVIFRHGKDADDVFAILPTLQANRGHLVVYQHVGQHCEGTWGGTIGVSRPAKPAEYRDLLRELRGIYRISHGPDDPSLVLVVRKRLHPSWRALREA